jgi:hypothetical protein
MSAPAASATAGASAAVTGAPSTTTTTVVAPQPQQQQHTWIKNHALEGDGLVTGFYNFLHKHNPKTMKACQGVFIPDTIVFDHNFPRGWYTSDLKAGEIMKRQGKELDAGSIYASFSKPSSPTCGIVASYMSSSEEDDPTTGETVTTTSVEFFNEATLQDFVGRKVKREGVLQKFVSPKGLRNSVLQAVWSPRVCMVQRRTNCGHIRDKLQCERDPYPVAVTYEGPSHYSEEGTCAAHTQEQIKAMCLNIVRHFNATEHKFITRMVLYFKADEKDQVWLLWCGSLRVSDRDTPSQMPLNLAPRFCNPSAESERETREEAALRAADRRHISVANDALFYSQFVKHGGTGLGSLSSPSKTRGASPGSRGIAGGPNGSIAGGSGAHGAAGGNGSGAHGSGGNGAKKRTGVDGVDTPSGSDAEDLSNPDAWYNAPTVAAQYRALRDDRAAVLAYFEDTFYEAYGHFLRHDPGAFRFDARRVAKVMGPDALQEAMHAARIDHALPLDDAAPPAPGGAATSIEEEELCFMIQPKHPLGPVTKLGDIVRRWVRTHYAQRMLQLREEEGAGGAPGSGVGVAA